MRRRAKVLHAVVYHGSVSETFIRDQIAHLDAVGTTETWIAAREVLSWSHTPVPRERVIVPPPSRSLRRRAVTRVALRFDWAERRRSAAQYRDMLAAVSPDIVHAHFGWVGIDVAREARRLGVPLLVTFHGTDLTVQASAPAYRAHYRRLFGAMDRAIVVSHYLERRLRALGYDGAVDVLPAGVDVERFRPTERHGPGPSRRLLFVGRLIECKGLDVLLRALPQIRASAGDVTLTVIGEGPERRRAEKLIDELGLASSVTLRGAAPHDAVVAELSRADVVVVPSVTLPNGQAEGSPVIPKEAFAAGVPVVATDTGGLPETIPPSLRTSIVPERDAGALAAQVTRLLQDPQEHARHADIGRRWAVERFSWPFLADVTLGIYDDLLARSPRGAECSAARPPAARAHTPIPGPAG